MRTIVINTSNEAINTRLDLLFKAPFDRKSLLWFDTELCCVQDCADDIKQALITDTDTVDRDYNLIVLVDLYKFPHSNEKDAVCIYKALVTKYIGAMLVDRLYSEFDLIPKDTAVYFADSAELENDWTTERLADNPVELLRAERRLDSENEPNSHVNKNGDIVDDNDLEDVSAHADGRNNVEKRVMGIFGWSADMKPEDFSWKMKTSITEDKYLDFSHAFRITAESIKRSDESARVLSIALESVTEILSVCTFAEGGAKGMMISVPEISDREYAICALTCRFTRENEQSLIESYFNLFANVFTCVRNKKLMLYVESYDRGRIAEIFKDALKKYRYFSDDRRITVNFEPITNVFENWERISEELKRAVTKENPGRKPGSDTDILKSPDEVASEIMADKSGASVNKNERPPVKLHGVDREFYDTVSDVFDNYDAEIIKEQNDRLVKNCLKCLWKWRDDQTDEKFRQYVEKEFNKNASRESYDKNDVNIDIAFMHEDYEREYTRLINSITETQHKLSANRDILLEAKELMIKYSDLMKKSKKYLICTVGAVVAVVAAALPYVYIQASSINENLIHRILYILFTAGFIALYGIASGIYIANINKKKRILKDALVQLKEKSETERRESIKALYTFYSDTVIKAETLYLLWDEVTRRKNTNAKKHIRLNNHKKRLEFLTASLKGFMTKLKLEVSDKDYEPTQEDIKRYEAQNGKLMLDAEKSFYDDINSRVYSILPIDATGMRENNAEGGEKQ